MRYPSLFARLVANTADPISDTGCWIWRGQIGTNHRPQISMRVDGKHRTLNAARVMLGLFYVLDAEAEASHLCADSYLCINPDHLLPETKRQNMARRWGKPVPAGRLWQARHPADDSDIPFNIDGAVNNRTLGEDLLLTVPSIKPTLHPCAERFGAMEQTA